MTVGRYPFAVTVTLAVKDVALSAVPVIFHEGSDSSTVELDPLACSWAISLSQFVKFPTVLRSVQTLCRFMNFLDVSRFDAAPLIAFIAAEETNYGTETNGRVPR